MKKICKKCNIEQPIENFRKGAKMKDGHINSCKNCDKIYNELNKIEIRGKRKIFYENNRERLLNEVLERSKTKRGELSEYSKKYYKENKENIIPKKAKAYKDNKKDISIKAKLYRENNKEKITQRQKGYYKENKKEIIKKVKLYRNNNKDKINAQRKKKKETDPLFKLKSSIRAMILKSLKRENYRKKSKTVEILGCTYKEFKEHLEGKFENWMNWENYGKYNGTLNFGWDIDHIVPLCTAKEEGAILKLNHFTNLQPLCSKVNRDIKRGII